MEPLGVVPLGLFRFCIALSNVVGCEVRSRSHHATTQAQSTGGALPAPLQVQNTIRQYRCCQAGNQSGPFNSVDVRIHGCLQELGSSWIIGPVFAFPHARSYAARLCHHAMLVSPLVRPTRCMECLSPAQSGLDTVKPFRLASTCRLSDR